jgi:ABC-2 type transport system ATP-binding protein
MGKEINRHEMAIKQEIGIVPQDIAVFEDLTAAENLDYFGRLYGLRGPLLKERIDEALTFTGLADRRKDRPKGFSGGMKRRLNIACAILHHPRLIIMDEPTVGIDPQSRNHIMQSIHRLNEMGSTIIYTTHYMKEVEELCTRIAIVDHGRLMAMGSREELTALVSSDEKLVVELSSVNYTLVEQIKGISGIRECIVHDNKIEIVGQMGGHYASRIIPLAAAADVEVIALNAEKPSLEDVFLTLTGRSLRD